MALDDSELIPISEYGNERQREMEKGAIDWIVEARGEVVPGFWINHKRLYLVRIGCDWSVFVGLEAFFAAAWGANFALENSEI